MVIIPGIIRNDGGLHDEIQIDDVLYKVTYNVWIWRSPDRTEKDEKEITITNTSPYLDFDSNEIDIIIEKISEKEFQ